MRGGHHRDTAVPARFTFGDVGDTRDMKETTMLRDVILWLAGVPIFVIILLHLFGVFH
jgi:hypothetical protein